MNFTKYKIIIFIFFILLSLLSFIIAQNLIHYYYEHKIVNQIYGFFSVALVLLLLISIYFFRKFYLKTVQQNKIANKLLDSQSSIFGIINIKQNLLVQVNDSFYDFFECKNIKEFLKSDKCISDFFIEEEGYLSRNKSDKNWVEYVLNNPLQTHLAKIMKNDKICVFKILVDKLKNKDEVVFTLQDITLETEKDKLLARSLSYNKALLDNNAIAIFLASTNRIIIEANKRACELFGYTQEDIVEKSFELIHISKEFFEKFAPEYKTFINSRISNFEYPFKRKDGRIIWCSIFGAPFNPKDLSEGIIWSLIDITEKKYIEKELEKERNLFREGPIMIFDVPFMDDYFSDAFQANYISPNCYEILGYTVDELTSGKNRLPLIIHKDDLYKNFEKEISILKKNAQSNERSYRLRLKNGEYKWFYSFEQYLRNEEGRITNIRGCLLDQTQLKEAEKMLYETNEKLIIQMQKVQEANQSKDRFLANVSHEIRTPMNAIIGLGESMLDTNLDEIQLDYMSKINASSELLLRIINDILDYSKIEAGKLKIELKPFDINFLLSELKIIFLNVAKEKGLKIYLDKQDNVPAIIRGDKLRLLQVLINFVSNSMKFTKKGKIICKIELLEKLSNTKAKIRFSVSDTGIGIEEDQIKDLFQPFTQVDDSNARKYEGTGLGLAICSKIVKEMNADIKVKSKINIGSEFSFIIDVDVEEWENDNNRNDTLIEDKFNIGDRLYLLEGLTVLLVEDNEINQEVTLNILNRVGIKVTIANNGKEGVTEFEKNQNSYDMILMDLQMPILNGYDATKFIRKIDSNIPIIALTAAVMSSDRQMVLNAGMNDHLSKPINKNKLYAILLKYCDKDKQNNLLEDFSVYHEEMIIDYKFLRSNIQTNKIANKLLAKFNNSLNFEFGNIVEDVKNNTVDVSSSIHSLKGSSGNLGAKLLYEACKRIDLLYKANKEISNEEILNLEKAIKATRNELSLFSKNKQNDIVNKESFSILLQTIKTQLQENRVVVESDLNQFSNYIQKSAEKNKLEEFQKNIDEFEYDKALKFLDSLVAEDD